MSLGVEEILIPTQDEPLLFSALSPQISCRHASAPWLAGNTWGWAAPCRPGVLSSEAVVLERSISPHKPRHGPPSAACRPPSAYLEGVCYRTQNRERISGLGSTISHIWKKKELLYKEPFKKVRLNLIASDLWLVSLREMVNCNHRPVFYASTTLK